MPPTREYYIEVQHAHHQRRAEIPDGAAGVIVAPARRWKRRRRGHVRLEMAQNSERLVWTEERLTRKFHQIWTPSLHEREAPRSNGLGYNLVAGANIAGFQRVADAMMAQGVF